MFVQCHVEKTDQFGNLITTSNTYHHQHQLLILEEM